MVVGRIVVVLLIAPLLAGCANIGAEGVQSADNKSVSNVKDSFGYAMSAVNKTKTELYKWENGAAQAMVGMSGAVQEGRVRVVIFDAAELPVFDTVYDGADSEGAMTDPGLAGVWTIELTFSEYYGALSLGVTADGGVL